MFHHADALVDVVVRLGSHTTHTKGYDYSIGEVNFFRRQIGRDEPLCFESEKNQ